MRKLILGASLLFSACVSNNASRNLSTVTDKKILESRDGVQRQKYFAQKKPVGGKNGRTSSEKQASESDAVAIYLPNQKTKYVQKPTRAYIIRSSKDVAELAALLKYVDSYKPNLGAAINSNLKMGVHSIQQRGDRSFVKFEQYVEREVGGVKYNIPVIGSSVVVTLKNNEVVSMLSAISNPPTMGIIFQNPGFDLSKVTGKELDLIRSQIQLYGKSEAVKKYLANIAANTGQKFDFESWIKDNPSAQLQKIKEFFAGIKKTSTAKILIDIARKKRLGFIQRNGRWNIQVTKAFGLPIEFDFVIPVNAEQKLMVKNIRDMRRDVSIEVHSSPNFPVMGPVVSQASDISTGTEVEHVTQMFQGILGYFREKHNWSGPSGNNTDFKLQVHKDISEAWFAENAFWIGGEFQLLGIGVGGAQLTNLEFSPSVLGHEYAHAMVEQTSGLVYQGQSGALNEHVVDVQGVMVEAHLKGVPYSYLVGSDIVTPEAAAPRQEVVNLILSANKVSTEEINKFGLNKIALRNMYQPAVSLFPQPSTMAEAESAGLGPTCEPSVENDSCGIHYLSGIPNRAISLIIENYGEENTRELLFNTAFLRLNSTSNFSEYARQMYEECLGIPKLAGGACDYVVAAFSSVGVELPDGDTSMPVPPMIDTDTEADKPTSKEAEVSPLKLCGWISISAAKNITIIDNKYDAVILNAENAAKFNGNYTKIEESDFNILEHKDCGCVEGSISQMPNSKNVWFNYFLNIKLGAVEKHKTTAPCAAIVFK